MVGTFGLPGVCRRCDKNQRYLTELIVEPVKYMYYSIILNGYEIFFFIFQTVITLNYFEYISAPTWLLKYNLINKAPRSAPEGPVLSGNTTALMVFQGYLLNFNNCRAPVLALRTCR